MRIGTAIGIGLAATASLLAHPNRAGAQTIPCSECQYVSGECLEEGEGTWELWHQGYDDDEEFPWCYHAGMGSHWCIHTTGVFELAPDGRVQLPQPGQLALGSGDVVDCQGRIARRLLPADEADRIRQTTAFLIL